MAGGSMQMSGSLLTRRVSAPRVGFLWKLRNLPNLLRGWRILVAWLFKIPTIYGTLHAVKRFADGRVLNFGLVSNRVVTTVFVNDMVDELIAETSGWGDYKHHDSGVGVTGAAVGDTDIETTDGESRVVGTQVENAANIYESVGTIAYSSTKAITEHGIANESVAGTLMDRHVFSAINVENGDSIEFTYRLTCTAGG